MTMTVAGASRPLRVGLLWHSLASGNLGVGALTEANLAILSDVAARSGRTLEPVIIEMRGERGRTAATVERFVVDRRSMLSPQGYWRLLGTLDCVIDIGGGDSFAEIYGAKRFFFLSVSKALTIARRVPLFLAPQTIGPFTRFLYRRAAAALLRRADVVVTRDKPSLECVRELAPRARVLRSVDVAFELPYRSRSDERNGDRIRVGVNVSGLLHTRPERFSLAYDYREFTDQLLGALASRPDVALHLFTHVVSGAADDDDARLADTLAARFPGAVRVPDFPSAGAAKSFISSLDFVVAARMHACIAAFSSGVPVVPVAYSRKFDGLFGGLGYGHVLPQGVRSAAAAVDQVMASLDNRAALGREVDSGLKQVDALLDVYRDAVSEMFARL